MTGDVAHETLNFCRRRLDRMSIERSAQKCGARAYTKTRFRHPIIGGFWTGLTSGGIPIAAHLFVDPAQRGYDGDESNYVPARLAARHISHLEHPHTTQLVDNTDRGG